MKLGNRNINDYLDKPGLVSGLSVSEIEKGIAEAKWNPALRAIHARKLFLEKDEAYEDVLATASLYALDRAWLKEFVYAPDELVEDTEEKGVKEGTIEGTENTERTEEERTTEGTEEKEVEEGTTEGTEDTERTEEKGTTEEKELEGESEGEEKKSRSDIEIAPLNLEEEVDLEEEVHVEAAKTAHQESNVRGLDTSGKDSFLGWLKQVSGEIKAHDEENPDVDYEEPIPNPPEAQEKVEEPEKKRTTDIDSAMERFVLAQQALKQQSPDVDQEAPMEIEKSIEQSDGIISETLAELLVKQGKPEKAIEMYQKLQLKYPDKSTFFAGRIEEIKKD